MRSTIAFCRGPSAALKSQPSASSGPKASGPCAWAQAAAASCCSLSPWCLRLAIMLSSCPYLQPSHCRTLQPACHSSALQPTHRKRREAPADGWQGDRARYSSPVRSLSTSSASTCERGAAVGLPRGAHRLDQRRKGSGLGPVDRRGGHGGLPRSHHLVSRASPL